jgi:lysophospholipid acyltransferase (LPLAT)-like uncharacterized protein
MKLRNNLAPAGAQDNSQFSGRPYELTFSQAMMYGLLKGWFATLRSTVLNADDLQAMLGSGRRFVCACWHSDVLYLGFRVPKPAVFIISPSKDGDIIAGLLGRCGYEVERGSRQKGGLAAIERMAHLMKTKGLHAGIVADGSRGPARRAQNGPVVLARDTGAWLLPVAMAARPLWRAGSWDRTKVPLPFARVVIAYEEPFAVPESARGEGLVFWKKRLADALNRAEHRAEDALK